MPRIGLDIVFGSITVLLLVGPVWAQSGAGLGSQPLKRALSAAKFPDDDRVAQGIPMRIELVPWQVALLASEVSANNRAQFCGGVIVGSRWVLTAAHCVDEGTIPNQIDVLSGTASLVSGGKRVAVAPHGITIHEKWEPQTHDFDIALVHTSEDLSGQKIAGLSVGVRDLTAGELVTVSGWGRLAFTAASGSRVLLAATVPYVSTEACNKKASYGGKITTSMLCAGKNEGGPDACRGDSGGPATIEFDGVRKLVGIVSWGEGCGSPKKFGVYSRVSQFREWIEERTRGDVRW